MQLLTQELRERLLANGRQQQSVRGTEAEIDFMPVVKLFTPDAGATRLLTEIDPAEPDIAFGLCDLGLGFPELGSVSLPVERDRHFSTEKTLSAYAEEALRLGRIGASSEGRATRCPLGH